MTANSIEYTIGFNAAMIAARLRTMTIPMAEAVAAAAIEMTNVETEEGLVWDGNYDHAVDAIGREIMHRCSGMELTAFVRQETLRNMVEPTLPEVVPSDASSFSNPDEMSAPSHGGIAQDIKEMMAAWETIELEAKKWFPHTTEEQLYKICKGAMSRQLEQERSKIIPQS